MNEFENLPVEGELERLLPLLCAGELSEAEQQTLTELLAQSAAARETYVRYLSLHADLMWRFGGDPRQDAAKAAEPFAPPSAAPVRSPILGFLSGVIAEPLASRSMVFWLVAVVTNAALVFVLVLALSPRLREHVAGNFAPAVDGRPAGALPIVVARLVGADRCRWEDDSPKPVIGSELGFGAFQLAGGIVELEFATGARVLFAGPSQFNLRSGSRVHLQAGHLRANVPRRAVGFTVSTPTADIVDLGTEFGVEVDATGESEVRVYKGQVNLVVDDGAAKTEQAAAKPPVLLSAGDSRRVQRFADGARIVDESANAAQAGPEPPRKPNNLELRQQARLRLLADPQLLVHYTFDGPGEHPERLVNRAPGSAGKYDGEIRSARWVARAQGDRHALSFDAPGAEVRMDVPRDLAAVSLAASIYLAPPAAGNSRPTEKGTAANLLGPEQWDRAGRFAWQLADDHRASLALFAPGSKDQLLRVPAAVRPPADAARGGAIAIANASFENLRDAQGKPFELPAGEHTAGLAAARVIDLKTGQPVGAAVDVLGDFRSNEPTAGVYRADNSQNLLNITGVAGRNVGFLNGAQATMTQPLAARLEVGTYTFTADLGYPASPGLPGGVAEGTIELLVGDQEVGPPAADGQVGAGVLQAVTSTYWVGPDHPLLGKPLTVCVRRTGGNSSLYFDNLALDYTSAAQVPPVPTGRWVKLAVSCDPAARQALFFVNGVLCPVPLTAADKFRLGVLHLGAAGAAPGAGEFRGQIDQFLLFGRALSANELSLVLQDFPTRP